MHPIIILINKVSFLVISWDTKNFWNGEIYCSWVKITFIPFQNCYHPLYIIKSESFEVSAINVSDGKHTQDKLTFPTEFPLISRSEHTFRTTTWSSIQTGWLACTCITTIWKKEMCSQHAVRYSITVQIRELTLFNGCRLCFIGA